MSAYILNAVSLNMIPPDVTNGALWFTRLPQAEAAAWAQHAHERGILVSAIGHEDTARIVGQMLGVPLPANRATVVLEPEISALVAQYVGPRLPEGATALPDGARVEFFAVTLSVGR